MKDVLPNYLGKTSEVEAYVLEHDIDEIYCTLPGTNNGKIVRLLNFAEKKMVRFYICLLYTSGLTFKLGKTDFEVLEPMDYALLNDLNGQINSLRAANDELSKRPVSCPECQETVTEVVNNYVDNVVYFRINSEMCIRDRSRSAVFPPYGSRVADR